MHTSLLSERRKSSSSSAPSDDYLSAPEHLNALDAEDDTDWYFEDQRATHKLKKQWLKSRPEGLVYSVLRYPLLICIGSIILMELMFYFFIRQFVNIYEYYIIWVGQRGKLRQSLRKSKSYDEWARNAQKLDSFFNLDEWKKEPATSYYDYKLISNLNRQIKRSSKNNDPLALKNLLLESGAKSNLGGIENVWLYSHTYFGTKDMVEEYLENVLSSLDTIATTTQLSPAEKRHFFKQASHLYGRSALCLSGGATLGYYHLGVIKALLDRGVLPKVITGTSAGSLIASIACTRTDEELQENIVPYIHQFLTACEGTWFTMAKRFFQTGALFDIDEWREKMYWVTNGNTTFLESYQRTGRILNITVVSCDSHSPPKLLNYVTAPNVVVWSAVLASSSIPGILNPVTLYHKVKSKMADGTVKETIAPFLGWGERWRDGSLRTDIPLKSLHQLFNVNYTIVSQVNPHVTVFFYENRGGGGRPTAHRSGRGWRGGFIASSLEHYLKLDLKKWLRVIRDLRLLPTMLDMDWSFIWLQKFDGNVTILPKSTMDDFLNILTDPTYQRMKHYIEKGQANTWPKLKMISNRMKVEQTIEKWRKAFNQYRKQQLRLQRRALSTPTINPNHSQPDSASSDPTAISPISPTALDSSSSSSINTDRWKKRSSLSGISESALSLEETEVSDVLEDIEEMPATNIAGQIGKEASQKLSSGLKEPERTKKIQNPPRDGQRRISLPSPNPQSYSITSTSFALPSPGQEKELSYSFPRTKNKNNTVPLTESQPQSAVPAEMQNSSSDTNLNLAGSSNGSLAQFSNCSSPPVPRSYLNLHLNSTLSSSQSFASRVDSRTQNSDVTGSAVGGARKYDYEDSDDESVSLSVGLYSSCTISEVDENEGVGGREREACIDEEDEFEEDVAGYRPC